MGSSAIGFRKKQRHGDAFAFVFAFVSHASASSLAPLRVSATAATSALAIIAAFLSAIAATFIGSCFADGDGRLYGMIGGGSGSPLSKTKFKTYGKKALICKNLTCPNNLLRNVCLEFF